MNIIQKLFRKAAVKLASTFAFAPTWMRYAFTKFSPLKLITEGYKQNSAVSACATTLQLTFPEPPLLGGYEDEGRFVADYKHPITKLLRNPNPDMGLAEFLQFAIAYAPIGGNCYIWKQRSETGKVVHLWPFSDLNFEPIVGHSVMEGFVSYYEFDSGDGKKVPVSKDDVIQWKWMVDPQNPHRGIGAIELSAREVDRDSEASAYIFALLKNNAVPPVVITLEEGDDPTQEELDALTNKWMQKHSHGQPAFISNGMKVEQMGYDLHKLAAETLADVPETRIAANFHVPPSVAGLNVGVKRSDYGDSAARKAFTEQTLMALWRSLASELLNGLKDDFNLSADFVIQFDIRNVGALQEQKKDQWERVTQAFNRSLLTRAEAKRELGMRAEKWDEVYFVSLASEFVPAGQAVVRGEVVKGQKSNVEGWHEAPNSLVRKIKASEKARAVSSVLLRVRNDVAGRMKTSVDVYFSGLADRVVERVKSLTPDPSPKGRGENLKADLPSADELVNAEDKAQLVEKIKRFYVEVIQLSWDVWNVALGIEKAFDLNDPAVTRALKMAGKHVDEIVATVLDEVRKALEFGSENGWSIDDLVRGNENQRGLRDIIDETYKNQARAIARSEMGQAQNAAAVERYREMGLTKVEIADGGDEDSAPACELANGQIWSVDLVERYSLQHPNCSRCPVPYFGEDEAVTDWPYAFGVRG
jgi:HK97 family phage portal protein